MLVVKAGMIDQNPWLSSGIGAKDGAGALGDFNRGNKIEMLASSCRYVCPV